MWRWPASRESRGGRSLSCPGRIGCLEAGRRPALFSWRLVCAPQEAARTSLLSLCRGRADKPVTLATQNRGVRFATLFARSYIRKYILHTFMYFLAVFGFKCQEGLASILNFSSRPHTEKTSGWGGLSHNEIDPFGTARAWR